MCPKENGILFWNALLGNACFRILKISSYQASGPTLLRSVNYLHIVNTKNKMYVFFRAHLFFYLVRHWMEHIVICLKKIPLAIPSCYTDPLGSQWIRISHHYRISYNIYSHPLPSAYPNSLSHLIPFPQHTPTHLATSSPYHSITQLT